MWLPFFTEDKLSYIVVSGPRTPQASQPDSILCQFWEITSPSSPAKNILQGNLVSCRENLLFGVAFKNK